MPSDLAIAYSNSSRETESSTTVRDTRGKSEPVGNVSGCINSAVRQLAGLEPWIDDHYSVGRCKCFAIRSSVLFKAATVRA